MTKSPYQAPEGMNEAVTRVVKSPRQTMVRVEFFVPKDVYAWLQLQCKNNGNAKLPDLVSHLIQQGIEAVQSRAAKPGFWSRVAAFFSRR